MKRAYLVSGGEIDLSFLKKELHKRPKSSVVVAVDAGLEYLNEINIQPDILVGDFDTVDYDILEKYIDNKDIKINRHSPIKDFSDTELAIDMCLKEGYHEIYIFAALGRRFDHSLANLYILCKSLDRDAYIQIMDEYNKIYVYDHSFIIEKNKLWGDYISFFPMGGSISDFSVEGVKYPLNNATIDKYKNPTLTISNEIIEDEARVSFKKGLLLIVESKDKIK